MNHKTKGLLTSTKTHITSRMEEVSGKMPPAIGVSLRREVGVNVKGEDSVTGTVCKGPKSQMIVVHSTTRAMVGGWKSPLQRVKNSETKVNEQRTILPT